MDLTFLHYLTGVLLFGVLAVSVRKKRQLPLPPGPPKKWFSDNNFPDGIVYRAFEEWAKIYGPVISLKQGFNDVIVITRHKEAVEILEKEGAVTMDRPKSIAMEETLCASKRLLTMRVGDRLKKYRRVVQNQLSLRTIAAYQPLQLQNAVKMVNGILKDPDGHQDHAECFAASVTITLTYGKATPSRYSDTLVQNILFYSSRFGRVVRPNTYLVDSFPLLRYVPGYLTELKQWHAEELGYYKSLVEDFKVKRKTTELIEPCFLGNLLDKQKELDMSDDEIAFLSGSLFAAGSDTSSSSISIVMMAAACFPDEQTAVQAQIEEVIGKERYPTFDDETALPRVTAFVLESFRWRPVSAGGFSHRAIKDIIWQGYRIPAGATIIGNHWSIARSPDVFPDPERFDHTRWLTQDGKLRDDLKSFNFGFGRRVCPGQQLASRSVFICAAMVLWAFRISQNKERPIDTYAFTPAANVHPLPFSLVFEPRIPAEELGQMTSGK